jgi:dihydrolipoamide dehydrogenase
VDAPPGLLYEWLPVVAMQTRRVDVAVIGAGTAGLAAFREAEKNGAEAVLIEDGPYGTTCARVGCMPSKLLIAAADVAHQAAHAERFGVHVSHLRVDGRAVLERVRRERDRFVAFVLESTEAIPAERRLRGRARFLAPTMLEVGDDTRLETRAVVIATGSHPVIPDSLAAVRDRILVNDDVFDLPDLPQSVAVVGTGVIGLELGQALHRLGVRTTLFSHTTTLGPIRDPEVARVMRAVFAAELDLCLGVELRAAPAPDGGCVLRWKGPDGSGERHFAALLAAAGRRPSLAGLGLEKSGVALDANGVPLVDPRTMQCGESPIFLAGDVSALRPVLHEAADEGHIAGGNAARYPEVHARVRRVPLQIAFTDPQIAVVGGGAAAAQAGDVEVGQVCYDAQGRARVMGKNAGLVRIYAGRECGELRGAEMFGPGVEHTAHLLAWAVQGRLDVEAALAMPYYHPVVEEGIRTALRDLSARLKVRTPPAPLAMECGPGT